MKPRELREMSDNELENRWLALMAQIPDEQRSMVEPALPFYYLDRGKVREARERMSEISFSDLGQRRLDFLRATTEAMRHQTGESAAE